MKTIPFRETVAGDALSMLCTSKMILQFGAIEIRSPLASVKVLLSSSTEFKFSIQMASTGPSNNSHTWSPCCNRNVRLSHGPLRNSGILQINFKNTTERKFSVPFKGSSRQPDCLRRNSTRCNWSRTVAVSRSQFVD